MIRDDDLAGLLRSATEDIAVPVVPTDELLRAGRRRVRRRRAATATGATSAVALAAVAIPLAAGWLPQPGTGTASSPDAGSSCADRVPAAVLPGWARGGFSDARPRIPYVMGQSGDMVAILFAQPLTSPPAPGHGNKILWVARPQSSTMRGPSSQTFDLHIDARLADGSATAERTVPGGPGPSIIDLPKPGCWQLTLRWSGHRDELSLAYAAH
jgi:hypothetical protein